MDLAKRTQAENRDRHREHLERLAAAQLHSDADQVVGALETITDPEDERDLEKLEIALRSLANLPRPEEVAPALFRVFERFPWSDGFESFWSVLHALERMTGYEPLLIESVRRTPGEFNLLMINRLLNAGITSVAGTSLLAVLREVADRPASSDRAREVALDFLKHQPGTAVR